MTEKPPRKRTFVEHAKRVARNGFLAGALVLPSLSGSHTVNFPALVNSVAKDINLMRIDLRKQYGITNSNELQSVTIMLVPPYEGKTAECYYIVNGDDKKPHPLPSLARLVEGCLEADYTDYHKLADEVIESTLVKYPSAELAGLGGFRDKISYALWSAVHYSGMYSAPRRSEEEIAEAGKAFGRIMEEHKGLTADMVGHDNGEWVFTCRMKPCAKGDQEHEAEPIEVKVPVPPPETLKRHDNPNHAFIVQQMQEFLAQHAAEKHAVDVAEPTVPFMNTKKMFKMSLIKIPVDLHVLSPAQYHATERGRAR